jgi:hypothetical protein
MKRLIHDWRFGFQLLVRLVIAFVCMAVGAGMLLDLQIVLHALHLSMPHSLLLLLQVLYVVLFCPFILASYARYCGFGSRSSERPSHDIHAA